MRSRAPAPLPDDPLWYKEAIIYEVRVRSFYDSDGDGIGDFRGLTAKLDYLQDLGVTALWLLPFYLSPLRDDGYDIADYTGVHPECGTLNDFKTFLREAHKRGLRVITELVLNHTSDQHPWFQRSRRARPGSAWRNFYVWSQTGKEYADARIIFKDFETSNWTWDPVAGAYLWHRFYSNQPDLNFDNPAVRTAMFRVMDFWFEMGVDGMRLDAVPYLYEREGTNCENLPETHGFLRELRRHVDSRYPNRMFLAEANQWPEDSVAYFGQGDECHMAFHFPIMPRMFMAIQMEDRYPIVEILDETPPIPETCQWALFLRNHDELTLEMVTDEERDYMYRMFAHDQAARINLGIRRRLAPLLGNNRRKIELMNGLLFSLPGTPVIYYGDEIGMGDNIYLGDRNGVRTPMQWSPDRNAGFSHASPQRLFLPVTMNPEYHYEAINVETQQGNPQSLLWWMKRLVALRKRYPAFGRGDITFLTPANPKVLAFVRRYEEQRILVVANLSRFVQAVELELPEHNGTVPVELFGMNPFPTIGELPYLLTLGPHSFYWFVLTPPRVEALGPGQHRTLEVSGEWTRVLQGRPRAALEALLPGWLRGQRWFGGKAHTMREARVDDTIPVPTRDGEAVLALLRADYSDAPAELYLLPLAFAAGERARALREQRPGAVLANLNVSGVRREEGVLFDALADPAPGRALLEAVVRRRRFKGQHGALEPGTARGLRGITREHLDVLEPRPLGAEQSNTTLVFGDELILKVFRRPDEGINPDLEIGRFLTEGSRFEHTPAVAGYLEYERGREPSMTVGILHRFVPNHGDAWRFTLDELSRYYERMLAGPPEAEPPAPLPGVLELAEQPTTDVAHERIGAYLEAARLLGRRTAELHLALASDAESEAFRPEAFSTLYQRSLYQAMRSQASHALALLRRKQRDLPEAERPHAARILQREPELVGRLRAVVGKKLDARRIRCHGDYHLGQVLWTGKDFVIIDFEGEPARPVSERRIKRSPLRDVAGMLRSFDYAAHTGMDQRLHLNGHPERPSPQLAAWAGYWERWSGSRFLQAYLEAAREGNFLPTDPAELGTLLDLYLLQKALYELSYELNNRPDWVWIPIQGLLQILDNPIRARA
jgi:maltose alpha-D-glucosyltransferase / alpha-amylase